MYFKRKLFCCSFTRLVNNNYISHVFTVEADMGCHLNIIKRDILSKIREKHPQVIEPTLIVEEIELDVIKRCIGLEYSDFCELE